MMAIIPIRFARAVRELATRNVLALRRVRVRFQIGGGEDDALGIADAQWELRLNDVEIASGRTDANGEVSFLIAAGERLILNIFGTDYRVGLHPGLEPVAKMEGRQKRLDALGYLTGYLRDSIGNAVPDDGEDGVRTRQAVLNLQCDRNLVIDSVAGRRTRATLTTDVGE